MIARLDEFELISRLIGIDETNADMSGESQARRKFRIETSHEFPEKSLALRGVVLGKPVKANKAVEIRRWANGVMPAGSRNKIEIGELRRVSKRH